MGGTSREKGKRGERECAALLKAHGFDARRGQQFNGSDGSADVVGLPGFHVEVKRSERLSVYEAMGQAESDALDGEIPLVLHRRNRREWLAVLKADDFLEMIKNG